MGRSFLAENISAVELPRAIEAAIDRYVGLSGNKPVAVVAEYPAHLPAVQGQRHELAKIITSLIAEGISITEQGEIHVTADLLSAGDQPQVDDVINGDPQTLVEGGPWAMIRIAVIGSDFLEDSFGDVVVNVNRTKAQPRISRDGYSIDDCRTRIESYGGRFWIDNLAGERIRLNFALPLRTAYLAAADLSSLRRAVETRLPEGKEDTKTILLMTEEQGLRDLLSHELLDAGYVILAAQDGPNLLAMARTENPDLILLDLDSRDQSGFDTAMVLKQDHLARNIPLLFLTSSTDPDAGMKMGAVGFVIRTEGTGKLLSAINAVLESGLSPTTARVLVIEPDDVVRESMILMIQSQGYRVTEARGPEEALALAERVEPSLVLVNAEIAHERDYWLLRSLRQRSHDVEIFVLADFVTEEDGAAAIRRGASGYSQTGQLREILEDMKDRISGQE
jgi:DNA-binding response OmpR family regulator